MKGSSSFLQSFGNAIRGIQHSLKTQRNMRIHGIAALAVVIAGFYFHVSMTDWCLLAITTGLVLVSEIINTALETLVDLVSPDYHPKAGLVKDMAAGAVLVSAIISVIVAMIIFLPRLLQCVS